MVFEHLSDARASRDRPPRNVWPFIIAVMAVIGAISGWLIAQH